MGLNFQTVHPFTFPDCISLLPASARKLAGTLGPTSIQIAFESGMILISLPLK